MDNERPDFKPVNFRSENELNDEVDLIVNNLSDIIKDWKLRDSNIKIVGGILSGNWGNNPKFAKLFNSKLTPCLSIQMLDLRTTIMREACNIISFAAKTLGDQFELSSLFLTSSSVLFKLIASANRVICEGGSQCLEAIVNYVNSSKLIAKIIEQSSNKNPIVRLRAAQNILYILSNYEQNLLEKNLQSIENFIHSSLHDSTPDVRNSGKKIYLAFMRIYPSRAQTILIKFDNPIQKAVKELIKNSSSMNCLIGPSKVLNNNFISENKKKDLIDNPKSIEIQTFVAENNKMNESKEKDKEQIYSNYNNYNTNIFSSSTTIENSSSFKNSKSKSSISNNSIHSSPKVSSTPPKNQNSDKKPQIRRNSKNKSQIIEKNSILIGDITKNIADDRIPLPVKQKHSDYENYLKELMIKSNSTNDSIRISVIEKIFNIFKELNFNLKTISNHLLENIIELFIRSIKDKKSTIEAMDVLEKIVDKSPFLLSENDIFSLLIIILENIACHNKEISHSASNLLITIKKNYNSDWIIKPIVEGLENDCVDETYIVSLEVILIMLDESEKLLKETSFINNFILNLSSLLFQKKDVKEILCRIIDIFDKIYRKYPSSLINCFNNYLKDFDIKKNLVHLLDLYKKDLAEFILINNNENNKQNKNIYTNSNIKVKSSEKKENLSINENDSKKNNQVLQENNKLNKINISNQKTNKLDKLRRKFPDDYDLSKQLNNNLLIKAYKNDCQSFANIISMNELNIEEFLLSLNKVQSNELNHILEHISFLLKNNVEIISKHTDLLINRLSFLYENFPDNYELINHNFNLMSKQIEGNIFLSEISNYIYKSNPAIVQIILNTLNNSFSKLNKDHLLNIVPNFIDSLFFSLNHKITEIRKLSVFCVVELYFILGHEMEKYISQLNTAQKNLISIYINKRNKKQ